MKLLLFLVLLQDPADLYKAAIADMDAGRLAEAAEKFERILQDDPRHIPTEFNLAVCRNKLGDSKAAEGLYRKIIEQDENIYEARFNLAVLLFQADRLVDADEHFLKAASMRPKDAAPVFYHARILEQRGDATEALKAYESAQALNPDDSDVRLAALAIRRQLGIQFRAAKQFDQAIEILKPLGSSGNLELALTYFDKKDFANAGTMFESLASSAPDNADYLYMLGKCQMELKQYEKAVVTLQQVLKLSPGYVDAYSTLGTTYYFQQNWPSAAATLEKFIQFKPQQAFTYFIVATCYDKLAKLPQALLNYNKFLAIDDGSNDARSFQARQRARILERRIKKQLE